MKRMTPNEFLESGFLEEYTMGLLSDEKAKEVQAYIEAHPTVKAVYDEHQKAIRLAALVGALAIYSFAMWKSTVRELKHQQSEYALLKNDCERSQKESAIANNLMAFYQNPDTQSAILTGNSKADEFSMVARYNPRRSKVALEVLSVADIPSDKVLCLWGDKDGKMILITKLDQGADPQMVAYDKDMESLNVTIEEKSDVIDHPDVSQLIASVAIG